MKVAPNAVSFIKKIIVFCCLLFIAGMANAQVPSYLPANGLVGWYPFTGNAIDSTGNGNDGIVVGAVPDTDRFGKPNSAYNFDGIDNHITGSSSNFPTDERTVSLWFYTNDIGSDPKGRVLLGYGGGICGTSWVETINNLHNGQNTYEAQNHCEDKLVRYYYGTTHPNGAWHNWIITTASGGTNFYIDGNLAYTSATFISGTYVQDRIFIFGSEINPDGASYIAKGGDTYVSPFKGKLDDIGIWNRALTPCEIREVFTGKATEDMATVTPLGSTAFCSPDSVILMANSNDSYQWYRNTAVISGATQQNYTASQAGDYTVAVSLGSCIDTSDIVTVTVNSGAQAGNISSPHDTICENTYNTLTLTGSAANLQWQEGNSNGTFADITGATDDSYSAAFFQTTYFRVITGSGSCADTSNVFTLVVNPTPTTGNITSVKDTICETTLANLSLQGSSANLFQWQQSNLAATGFTNIAGATSTSYISGPLLQNTYFRVVVTSGTCSDTTTEFKIIVIPSPDASFAPAINGDTVLFNASSSGATSYLWDFNDGTTSADLNPTHVYDTAGTYHVCLTVKNSTNCNFTVCQNITINPTGIKEINNQEEWQVYPNPVSDELFINTPGAGYQIISLELYDMVGKKVKRILPYSILANQYTMDVSGLAAGIYCLRIKSNGWEYIKKVVKE